MNNPLILLKNVTVDYIQKKRSFSAVRKVSLEIKEGTTLGLVGESGCGKSTLGLALMGLLPERESRVASGEILYRGQNLLAVGREPMRAIRGRRISMIFQDPFSSLNPVMTIGEQMLEAMRLDDGHPQTAKVAALLEEVQLSNPDRIVKSYPHQLSGGQRQRVLIAMALCRRPELLVADEPTTALDVIVQDEIVKLLSRLQRDRGMAMLFITHNIGLIKLTAHETAVMYAGEIIESGATAAVIDHPQHPYTQALLRSLPSLQRHTDPLPMLEGQPPEPARIPAGCPFHPRCTKILPICQSENPASRQFADRRVSCHLY